MYTVYIYILLIIKIQYLYINFIPILLYSKITHKFASMHTAVHFPIDSISEDST